MKKVMVILGSVREGRTGDHILKQLKKELDQHKDLEFDYVDLKDLDLPFYDEPASPVVIGMGKAEYTNPAGKVWAERVGKADGFIYVFPEYNHSFTAVLKNAFEWVGKEWEYKPVTFVTYGVLGGLRAAQSMRPVVLERRMFPLHDQVHIPQAYAAFNEDGEWNETHTQHQDAFAPMVAELKDFFASYNHAK